MKEKVSRINICKVEKCAYNIKNKCHAIAITVGGPDPLCDTYTDSMDKGGMMKVMGGVGACKVMNCSHNKSFMCHAGNVSVGYQESNARCYFFKWP